MSGFCRRKPYEKLAVAYLKCCATSRHVVFKSSFHEEMSGSSRVYIFFAVLHGTCFRNALLTEMATSMRTGEQNNGCAVITYCSFTHDERKSTSFVVIRPVFYPDS